MKVNFAICDDNLVDLDYVKQLVIKWANNKEFSINIDVFSSAEAFLFSYVENKQYDCLLLDIEMGKMDGVSLAREIRKVNTTVQIIFITGYTDYIIEGYDVWALHYLMKPINDNKLFSVLDRAVDKIIQSEKNLVLNLLDEMICIPLHEIYYLDVDRNYVTVHAKKDYTIKKTLHEIEKELDDEFYRISRSTIVNLKYVNRTTKKDLYLTNGVVLQLPRGMYDNLNRAIIKKI